MKLWLITVGEPLPLPGATDRLWRTGMLARVLASRGHDVLWWTSTVDHFHKEYFVTDERRVDSTVGAQIQFLHGRLYRRNISFARLRNHAEVGRRFRVLARQEPRPDAILCSFPTIELSHEAVSLGVERGVPVALDVRDLWPDIFLDVLPGFAKWAGRALLAGAFRKTREALRGSNAVYGVSPKYLEWGLERAGRGSRPADAVFPLGYELPEWGEEDRRALEEKLLALGADPLRERAAFVGTFGRTYDLATVIEAARRLGSRGPQFVLCGAGEREAEWRNQAAGLPNITFAGWLPAGQLGCLLSTASYGLAAYAAQAPQGLPNKVIEYMAAGLPVLCTLPGEARQLLVGSGCGVYYAAGDAGGLADALSALAADPERRTAMGAAARAVYAASYSAGQVFNDMADRFESLARAGRSSAES